MAKFHSSAAKIAASILITCLFLQTVRAQTLPGGFSRVKVASIDNATAMAFAPDGRLFIAQKDGHMRIVKNGALLATPFFMLTVAQDGERGISGIAFDPGFSTNHYLYVYYTATTPSIHNRLSRFTANGDVVLNGSEVTLLDFETVTSVYHNGGGMGFGADGKLYLSMGEDNLPSNAQNLGTHKGKLLRLNADGTTPSTNPYYSSTNSITRRIWCYGLRNPYTLDIQRGTGKIYVNNVGADTWEEVNDGTAPGQNFGWPIVEGFGTDPAYTNPVFAYPHDDTGQHGCAITGGCFFNPSSTTYPAQYVGKYFYQDFCNGWMYYFTPGTPATNNTFFGSGLVTQNLALQTGPDGNLYFINRYNTDAGIYKIVYTNSNAPIITSQPQSQTVTAGQHAMFSVAASGAAPLSYQWKKNGANIPGANATTYSITSTSQGDAGQYTVLVSNSYGSVLSSVATLSVTAFNAAPVATINTPPAGSYFRAGDTIYFSGSASDAEDGTLPASAFSWQTQLWHNHNHFHPGTVIPPGVKSGSFVTSRTDHTDADIFYRIVLTVTDSHGLTDTAFVDVLPRTVTLNFTTQPAGLQIVYAGQPKVTPFTTQTTVGNLITISAVSPQSANGNSYAFDHWDKGGANSHVIEVGAGDSSYKAYFHDTVVSCTAQGSILREYWAGISGGISSIPLNSPPTSVTYPTIFEGPSNVADHYGDRMRGYICAPITGNYIFWIASDDNSELYLSTNDNPANKQKIAYVTGWTGSREWTKYASQQSAPVFLTANTRYYIEALHADGTQGDNLAVGWQLPGGTFERPIPGMRLAPYGTPTSGDLLPVNSQWKYLDNGSNQGTAWRAALYNDASWKTGNAELGYGDGGEATVVSYGPSSTNKYITTYFRKTINVTNTSSFSGLELRLIRDDGVVVYINGTEVYRNNMPGGSIQYNTLAPTYIDGVNETTWLTAIIPNTLVNGSNQIAVEIHQNSPNSSDISFNMGLKATTLNPDLITAGASWKYLDNGTDQGTAWRAGAFNDGTWKIGNAELGYGDGGEATVVSYGPSSTNKYVTTYFRKAFSVTSASSFTGVELSLIRDDGVVVYLNGTEIYRNNMPAGAINYSTLAPTYIDDGAESAWIVANLANTLINGTNTIAVEIHQDARNSSDISFNLKLKGITAHRDLDTSAATLSNTTEDPKHAFLVYPNPNSGKFTLEFSADSSASNNLRMEIYNVTGQLVYKKELFKTNGTISTVIELDEALPGGVYVMNLVSGDLIECKRIVLKK